MTKCSSVEKMRCCIEFAPIYTNKNKRFVCSSTEMSPCFTMYSFIYNADYTYCLQITDNNIFSSPRDNTTTYLNILHDTRIPKNKIKNCRTKCKCWFVTTLNCARNRKNNSATVANKSVAVKREQALWRISSSMAHTDYYTWSESHCYQQSSCLKEVRAFGKDPIYWHT